MFHSHAHRVDFEKHLLCQQCSLCGSHVYVHSHKVRRFSLLCKFDVDHRHCWRSFYCTSNILLHISCFYCTSDVVRRDACASGIRWRRQNNGAVRLFEANDAFGTDELREGVRCCSILSSIFCSLARKSAEFSATFDRVSSKCVEDEEM